MTASDMRLLLVDDRETDEVAKDLAERGLLPADEFLVAPRRFTSDDQVDLAWETYWREERSNLLAA